MFSVLVVRPSRPERTFADPGDRLDDEDLYAVVLRVELWLREMPEVPAQISYERLLQSTFPWHVAPHITRRPDGDDALVVHNLSVDAFPSGISAAAFVRKLCDLRREIAL